MGNAIVKLCGGVPSTFLGGYIADKYSAKYPRIKGYLAAGGALISSAFIVVCYML
jgi:hypothetical protein